MAYWGMDVSAYPGNTTMQAWKNNSNLRWTGFYLAPAPYHSNTGWMNKLSTLQSYGWNVVPIYVGLQYGNSSLSYTRGQQDGLNAINLATSAGFSNGTFIYLDIEQGGILPANFLSYINGWVDTVYDNGTYKPGIYCSYTTVDNLNTNITKSALLRYWVFHIGTYTGNPVIDSAPAPYDSGCLDANSWQLVQNISKTFGGYNISPVDFSSAYSDNPAI